MAENLPPFRVLPPADFGQYEFQNNTWCAWIKPPRELADAVNPAFWAHNIKWLKRGDLIWVKAHDLSFISLLVCKQPAPNLMIVPVKLAYPESLPVPEEYEIKWNVGSQGYDVYVHGERVGDSKSIKSRDEAQDWIIAHRMQQRSVKAQTKKQTGSEAA